MKKAYLILQDGTVFEGNSFGAEGSAVGEIVFTTNMWGYLETLTDQSYHGQIILHTFPLIGNYGIIPQDFESAALAPKGYIVKHPCPFPSNFRNTGRLDSFLAQRGIVGLCGIDTRKLTKIIRQNGVMNGKITTVKPGKACQAEAAKYSIKNAVAAVSCKKAETAGSGKFRVALMDYGAKRGIAEALVNRGCTVTTLPHGTSFDEILKTKPHGIMLSNGPGDPAEEANAGIIATIKKLQASGLPMFGICLGHQLMALANGYKTAKLKFGHRGGNQPVKELATGRVFITSQNHGYEVLAPGKSSFVNVNDGTCEGLDYGRQFTVQFHPEARGGPLDTAHLFDKFIKMMEVSAL